MTAIDTVILADPDSCRDGARYLTKLAEANHAAGTALNQARTESEADWAGTASEAFRDQTAQAARGR